ncbi:MAG: YheU family protein [Myxococcota bacterium]
MRPPRAPNRDGSHRSLPGLPASEAETGAERGVELPPDALSPQALRGLVEEFVSREGTDYGQVERTLASKVADVMAQLATGEARIVFDLESETASIVAADDVVERDR